MSIMYSWLIFYVLAVNFTIFQSCQNAVIVDRQVKVESYFDGTANPSAEAAVEEDTAKAHAAAASGNSDPHTKTFTHVIAEMLAAGYVLSDNVVHKGHELDGEFLSLKFDDCGYQAPDINALLISNLFFCDSQIWRHLNPPKLHQPG